MVGVRIERQTHLASANSASLDRPSVCGPSYHRPPAESSHGSYERRALFQELCQIPVLILYPSQKVGSSAAKKMEFPKAKTKNKLGSCY